MRWPKLSPRRRASPTLTTSPATGQPSGDAAEPVQDDSLVVAKQQLNSAVEDLIDLIRNPEVLEAIGSTDRTNLAKYLTIAKLRLENAIAVVRTGDADR